jgi:hypothetical protein
MEWNSGHTDHPYHPTIPFDSSAGINLAKLKNSSIFLQENPA